MCVGRSLCSVWAKACPLSALVDHFIFSNLKYVFKDCVYKEWHDNDFVPAKRHVSLTPLTPCCRVTTSANNFHFRDVKVTVQMSASIDALVYVFENVVVSSH